MFGGRHWGCVMHRSLQLPIETIKPNPRNVRTHSKKQVAGIAESIKIFGFLNPGAGRLRMACSSPDMEGSRLESSSA